MLDVLALNNIYLKHKLHIQAPHQKLK